MSGAAGWVGLREVGVCDGFGTDGLGAVWACSGGDWPPGGRPILTEASTNFAVQEVALRAANREYRSAGSGILDESALGSAERRLECCAVGGMRWPCWNASGVRLRRGWRTIEVGRGMGIEVVVIPHCPMRAASLPRHAIRGNRAGLQPRCFTWNVAPRFHIHNRADPGAVVCSTCNRQRSKYRQSRTEMAACTVNRSLGYTTTTSRCVAWAVSYEGLPNDPVGWHAALPPLAFALNAPGGSPAFGRAMFHVEQER